MNKKNDQHKHKETWGHVEPGPLNEGEAAALGELKKNAADCENVKPTNMDPEPSAGEATEHTEERTHRWQMLSEEELKKFEGRKDGHPKN